MPGFVHLHVHTQYSIQDGAIRVKELVKTIAQREVKACAITDHGVMHGAVDFINKCKPEGVKPILGCELNITHAHPDSPDKIYHLTMLCRTLKGYENALEMLSKAFIENYDELAGQGNVKFEWLRDYSEGLTFLSGDLGSEIAQTIVRGGDVAGVIGRFRDVIEPGQLYLELMNNSFDAQKKVNECFKQLSKQLDLPLMATNDAHYLKRDEALAHAVLVCMGLEKRVDIDELRKYVVDDFYLKSDEEMYAAFSDVPEACENTVKFAESVNCPVRLGPVFLPQYKVPQSFLESHNITDRKQGIHEYFKEVARTGLTARLESFKKAGKVVDEKTYWERLEREIGVITQMDFPGYFLIVWDFIHWAKSHGVPVGPGRGSGAGSLVAYSMTITDFDPLPYSLLFERFLNPERVSMPDFDVDFSMDKRDQVINYVRETYGIHNVARIATFGALKPKAAVNSVGRVLNFLPSELRAITRLIRDDPALHMTLTKALAETPELKALVDGDPKIKQLYDLALQVEDLFCQTGVHACGLVISEGPLWDYVPVFRDKDGALVSQYAKVEVEQAGLVKFDFLGLKTLTVLETALENVNRSRAQQGQEPLDLGLIPLDDANVYHMISVGKTLNVFQLESTAFTKLLVKLKPDCFEDVIAAVALFRPGPLGTGMVDTFVKCKHGEQAIEYPHPMLEKILKETYGVFVYQEQVMQAAQVMANFTLGGADIMRRAMGKKKPEEMAKQCGKFVEGAVQNGVPAKRAEEIFELIRGFAEYGFNKSHSAAYALVTYQEAYLKCYYPVEHCAAHLTCDQGDTDKVIRTINDARLNGIKILPPDINESELHFSVVNRNIRFGLAGIKGVGEAALESVFKTRNADGPFKSLFDFCNRVDNSVNKRVIETLVQCGAFDSLWHGKLRNIGDIGAARASMFASIQNALDRSKQEREDRSSGQTSLFSLFATKAPEQAKSLDDKFIPAQPWPESTVLDNELKLIGYFISGHPLDHYRQEITRLATHSISQLGSLSERTKVTLCGLFKGVGIRVTKSGTKLASGNFEDLTGVTSIICFQKTLDRIGPEVFSLDTPVVLTGSVRLEGDDEESRKVEIMIDNVESLSDVRARCFSHIQFELDVTQHTVDNINDLDILLSMPEYAGNAYTYLLLKDDTVDAQLKLGYRVNLTDDFLHQVDQVLGMGCYELR